LAGWRGWFLGLVVSSVLFGLAHATNPSVSGLALLNIGLAGVAFALAYAVTGSLWLAIAYHFMWNFSQGPLLGLPVSGMTFETLTTATLTGPELWTGGAFGPEGGLAASLVLLVSIGGLWLYKQGKGQGLGVRGVGAWPSATGAERAGEDGER
jgi:membrane protease YdiL (CAAX protease family)